MSIKWDDQMQKAWETFEEMFRKLTLEFELITIQFSFSCGVADSSQQLDPIGSQYYEVLHLCVRY